MKTIYQLAKEQKEINKQLIALEKAKDYNDSALELYYKQYHKQLFKCGLYSYSILFDNSYIPLNQEFRLRDDSLPYMYCGEGDYKCIHFKIEGNDLVLNYKCTYYTRNYKPNICKIPLNLFDLGNDEKLQNFITDLLVNNRNEIIKFEDEKIEKKRQSLIKQLEDLK